MATVNLGKVKGIPFGEYDPSGATTYRPLDSVKYNGLRYACLASTSGSFVAANFSAFVDETTDQMATWAVSQLAGGDDTLVGTISAGFTITTQEWLIYPDTGLIFEVDGATGTFSDPLDFDPATGIDSGITGALLEYSVGDKVEKIENGLYKRVTINFASDADLTLIDQQNQYGKIKLTDTGGVLTGSVNCIVSDERELYVTNETGYDIKVKTVAGTGVHVPSGKSFNLYCDGVNVETLGCENYLIVKDFGTYTTGETINYPHSLTQDAFNHLDFNINHNAFPDRLRGDTRLDSLVIDEFPTSWEIVASSSSSGTTIEMQIDYLSNTSCEIISESNCRLKYVTATLKNGVSY